MIIIYQLDTAGLGHVLDIFITYIPVHSSLSEYSVKRLIIVRLP